MKKISILLMTALFLLPAMMYAQDEAGDVAKESRWTWGGFSTVQFGQTALVNWAGGGNSNISSTLQTNLFANYKKGKHTVDNTFNGTLGFVKNKGEDLRKNDDILAFNSKYGYALGGDSSKWFISGLLDFKSQFMMGYNYSDDGQTKTLNSRFAAPAYLTIALGVDYKPSDEFSLFLSPATGKFTIVRDDNLVPIYNSEGKNVNAEFGAYMRANLQKELFKNVTLRSTLELFNNYTDTDKGNRKNIDVDWQTGIDMKVNEWLLATISTHLKYDHDVKFGFDNDGDGVDDSSGPRTQFKESFTLGLTYKFGDK
ncbi:MAG: DUF3078 domain-containing protein [Chitinophagales bacterium]